jgi:hypothetical protein
MGLASREDGIEHARHVQEWGDCAENIEFHRTMRDVGRMGWPDLSVAQLANLVHGVNGKREAALSSFDDERAWALSAWAQRLPSTEHHREITHGDPAASPSQHARDVSRGVRDRDPGTRSEYLLDPPRVDQDPRGANHRRDEVAHTFY